MNPPIPSGTSDSVVFALWLFGVIITGLLVLTGWLLRSYLENQKTFQNEVKGDLTGQATKIANLTTEINSNALMIKKSASDIETANLKFQQTVNKELLELNKKTVSIEGSLDRVKENAEALEKNFDKTAAKSHQLYTYVEAHTKSLEAAGKILRNHKERIDQHDSQIRTVYKHLGKDVTIIGEEKIQPQQPHDPTKKKT